MMNDESRPMNRIFQDSGFIIHHSSLNQVSDIFTQVQSAQAALDAENPATA